MIHIGGHIMRSFGFALASIAVLWAGSSEAQSCKAMTTAQLQQLTAKGAALKLGGEGQGYSGTLKLKKDGTGKGSAKTDAGQKINFSGKWYVENDRFCRTWTGDLPDSGQLVCEKWCLTSGRSVDVFNEKGKIGTNSW